MFNVQFSIHRRGQVKNLEVRIYTASISYQVISSANNQDLFFYIINQKKTVLFHHNHTIINIGRMIYESKFLKRIFKIL